MTRRTACHLSALLLAAVAGCYTGPSDLSPPLGNDGTSTDGTEPEGTTPDGTESADGGGARTADLGLPCDVAALFAKSCTGCHATVPQGGAPNALVTYDDLIAQDELTGKSLAEVSLERMKNADRPMPPKGLLDAADVAVLEAWVKAGTPKGACGGPAPMVDGGTAPASDGGTSSATDGGTNVVTSVCTSGQTWTGGAPGPLMQPGKKCLACHAATGARVFQIAGSVYPTLHEPDGCFGATKSGLKVVVVDAEGVSHSMNVNANGNFYRITGIPTPYTAMVVDGTKTRVMHTPQTNGDCNACHTEKGDGSPGRIMLP